MISIRPGQRKHSSPIKVQHELGTQLIGFRRSQTFLLTEFTFTLCIASILFDLLPASVLSCNVVICVQSACFAPISVVNSQRKQNRVFALDNVFLRVSVACELNCKHTTSPLICVADSGTFEDLHINKLAPLQFLAKTGFSNIIISITMLPCSRLTIGHSQQQLLLNSLSHKAKQHV